ncbi:hypothetical protein AAW28_04975 [Lacticaseibacillus casei]|nr:hypothetical protein AAW28_04975 [Lacticaseibacillus casei]
MFKNDFKFINLSLREFNFFDMLKAYQRSFLGKIYIRFDLASVQYFQKGAAILPAAPLSTPRWKR